MSEEYGAAHLRQHPDVMDPAVALELFMGLLASTHLSGPADVAGVVAEQARRAGGEDLVIHLIDYENRELFALPELPAGGEEPARAEPLAVEGSVAGRCFSTTTILQTSDGPGRRRLWLPLLDGTERLGVLALSVRASAGEVPQGALAVWERLAHLAAQVVVSKGAYGDALETVRRTRTMSLAGELQWALLPPLTFATAGVVISAMVEPCYDNGGDAFDYAVNGTTAHVAVFDTMGHGLGAAGAAAFTLSAYRQARRAGLDLPATYAAVDAALVELYDGERYSTAVLAELDLPSGRLQWINAGHPEPLLLRDGRLVKTLAAPPSTPLGVPFTAGAGTVGAAQLEPGDRVLLYTDGLPEARQPDGQFFGVERLADFVERAGAAGHPAPETLRRLRHAVLQHQNGALQDDASALLLEWRRESERALLPQTVEPATGLTSTQAREARGDAAG